jgi:hypothetical protein
MRKHRLFGDRSLRAKRRASCTRTFASRLDVIVVASWPKKELQRKYIGTGVATVINLLNIERIVLGGGVMDAGELILNPIIHEARRRAFQPCFEATQIVAATLGKDSVAIGAAMLARDAAH